jgi:hypothetical protein
MVEAAKGGVIIIKLGGSSVTNKGKTILPHCRLWGRRVSCTTPRSGIRGSEAGRA